jgi:hypothetical protein
MTDKEVNDFLIKINREEDSVILFEKNTDISKIEIREDFIKYTNEERVFEYLKEEVGLIKKTSGSYDNYIVYGLTKKGKKIVRLGGWLKYIERQDKIEERQEKKENAELKITEFQSRNQNLPYIVSISGVIISIVALIINCSSNDGVLTQKKEHIMEYKSEKIKFETKKNLDLDTLLIERK